ncbi:Protein Dok-7, partial [Geodia barretti]
MDFREKILREGTLKHRQTGTLARWKNRYVVFKISGGGRLQFMIHKDCPPSPANEVKEIPIEEFGGIESAAKVDSEKHVFSIITTSVTDSFSTDGVEDLAEWTSLLQEYLGKELTFGIVIPQRHGQLKSGRGVLRIRNTGFTITTSDSPPRCMGTWQITHIRKFGGSSSFKFQTGSKCPTGEMLYTIKTDDNDRVKSLFNDLSQHKPIFSDDRVGRRMTLERNHTHHSPYRQSPSRLSLQSTSGGAGRDREGSDSAFQSSTLSPTYENKEAICEAAMKLGKPLPLPPNRRNSANDDCTPSLAGHAQRQGPGNNNPAPLSPALAKVDEQRLYQNIPGRSGSAPHSPTKLHRSGPGGTRYPIPPSEPVPDGYYNVSPPLALKKYPSTNSSSPPRLSPEDDTFFSEFAPVPPPPIKTVSSSTSDSYSDAYFRLPLQQRPMMMIEGENLVVHRTPNGGHVGGEGEMGKGGGREEAALYQNLDFMSKRGSDSITTANVYMEDTDSAPVHSRVHSGTVGHPLPIIPALDSLSEVVHNYTNVEFALEAAQGRGGGARIGGTSKPLARYVS